MSATLLTPPTKRSLLSEARHVVLPEGIVSSGFPAVEATWSKVGGVFDPWQKDLNRCVLAKDCADTYAADTVVLSIPRQVGKTHDVGALVFADSIINPGTTTVWTAHRFKVARETFNALKSIALSPQLAPHIDPDDVYTAAGNESITFRNGSRIVFAARERGTVRGFSKVRRLILDEAQILTEAQISDLVPTMNQAENPQIILMGTPPKPTDPGEVFTNLRAEALAGTSEGVLYVEFSAEHDADLDDVETWETANPSLHTRTPVKAIRRLRKLLSNADFAREALGIWDTKHAGTVIDSALWANLADLSPPKLSAPAFAVDVTPDRAFASLAVAASRPDGRRHVEVIRNDRGTSWVAEAVTAEMQGRKDVAVLLDASGPAGSLITPLSELGIEPMVVSTREMTHACGGFHDAVHDKAVTHFDQPPLNVAVDAARKRTVGDAWAWHRKDPTTDISPLVSVTLALFGHDQYARKPKRSGKVW